MTRQTSATRPSWVDDELFPFESRFVEVEGNTVHYVDEGSGPTLLLLHGNPTWSFVYRQTIIALRDRFRCVALDYPGFGLSTAAPSYGYLPEEHAAIVSEFIERLDLQDITVVVQDWAARSGFRRRRGRARGSVPSSSATPGPGPSTATFTSSPSRG